MESELTVRSMTRDEVDDLVEWAAREGWNPGLHDADIFWTTDADAFVAADLEGEMIGGGSIASYEGDYGFMGFFIVRPEYRGRGFGNALWHIRRERMLARLRPHATVGMDGVFDMQDYYARGGFTFSHRNMRFRADIPAKRAIPPPGSHKVGALKEVPFKKVLDYDRTCFPAARAGFLKAWISEDDHLALGSTRGGELTGYGVVRRCRDGCKIGPLFADDAEAAEALFSELSAFAAGGAVFLDAPENNPAAMELAQRHGMREVFGCARMYLGPKPALADERVFGVTTFELG